MAGTKRAENRAAMTADIKRLGREHLSTHGAAGLSLRAIARDMGVVSSAVYRYVPSRDDLLTLLLVDAYNDLADTVDDAMSAADSPRRRIEIAATTTRTWAVADPARWALLYGSPVPGYAAPAEQTGGPGTRVVAALLRAMSDAERDGSVRDDLPEPTGPLREDLTAITAEFGLALSPAATQAGTVLWATIIGAINLEVFGQYGPDSISTPESLFANQIALTLSAILG
ncbi:TetR/AcrR family transcriptional regulator [Gordonia crocea]|uniref:TetR family transcriptional regulator n=1 Tax=Gordonia crocea TaxID=589162 RepID=A0A7I9V2S4_9ACTN|nr:TetR-like C-terminal domain-containing protein [Gordonia crocea]GED99349.1 TetR family transcriptional regulator [Gordonia crocea]